MELKETVAIVTGGAVRIGRAISLALAEAGSSVVVHYSHSDRRARETVDEIVGKGGTAIAVAADFENPVVASEIVVEAAVDRFGRADVLVNSAAIFEPATLATTGEAQYDRNLAINLKAPFFLCRQFAARKPPGRHAAIINIVDWRGLRPVPGHLPYTLAKAGMVALTRILAAELAPEVRVNAVAPGAILAPAGADRDYMKRVTEHIPLQRSGGPDDVTAAVLYLLRADFVTGEVLCVTGGEEL